MVDLLELLLDFSLWFARTKLGARPIVAVLMGLVLISITVGLCMGLLVVAERAPKASAIIGPFILFVILLIVILNPRKVLDCLFEYLDHAERRKRRLEERRNRRRP